MKAAFFPKIIDKKESTLILGSFESIHNGHMKLISNAKKYKKPIAMMLILDPKKLPGHSLINYASIEIRLDHLAKLGISKVSVVKFDDDIRLLDGKEFLNKIIKATNAKKIVVGQDFACGIGRNYNARKIVNDFDAEMITEYKVNGKKLGTTLLKEMVQTGEVNLIKKISPFPYMSRFKINENMTFSFANHLKPHPGIYVVDAVIQNMRFWGYVHVGMEAESKLFLSDLKIKNRQFDATIGFHKMSKIIISKNNDLVTKSDEDRINEYFRA